MQSICSLYIHRIYAVRPSSAHSSQHLHGPVPKLEREYVPNQKMASIYPGQRLFPFFCWVRHPWNRAKPEHQRGRRRRRFTGGGRCSDAVLVVRRRTVKVKSMHRATSPDDSVLSTSSNSSDNVRMQYQCILHIAAILFILQYFIPAGSRQADDQSCAVARPVRRRQLRQIRCAVREGEVSTAPVVGQHVESISFATKPTLPATV